MVFAVAQPPLSLERTKRRIKGEWGKGTHLQAQRPPSSLLLLEGKG